MGPTLRDPPVENIGMRLGFAAAIMIAAIAMLLFATFDPLAMERPAVGPVPLSLVLAAAMIAFAILLTGLYVYLAGGRNR